MITLKEIAEAIDLQMDESQTYYDRETHELIYFGETTVCEITGSDINDLPQWEQEEAKLYKLIQEDDEKSWNDENYQCRFVKLPRKFDVHEYKLMELFSAEQDGNAAVVLSRAIRGKGAFRYFRDTIERLGLSDKWYEYRQKHLLELAKEFCEANEIEYKE
jgi:hypothetical protein